MIKHHPKFELLQTFVQGDLPASLSAGIAMHAEMCPTCQQQIADLTEQMAAEMFETNADSQFTAGFEDHVTDNAIDELTNNNTDTSLDFDSMIDNITTITELELQTSKVEKTIAFKDHVYTLPTALNNMPLGKTAQIGKLVRTRVQLDENEIHTNLLHIEPGGSVPEHTHKGFELTLLLSGSFTDEHGEYVKGDFIMLDSSVQHQPSSEHGCLCYTVANDALHFTQGINKLLNPIGSFIY